MDAGSSQLRVKGDIERRPDKAFPVKARASADCGRDAEAGRIGCAWYSPNSTGMRYRVTAAVLTFVAGTLQWWQGLLHLETKKSEDIIMSAVYLAVGVLAAWFLASRNVRTEI